MSEGKKAKADNVKKAEVMLTGYELNPPEVKIQFIFTHHGKDKILTHVLKGRPGREAMMNIHRESSKKKRTNAGIQIGGNIEDAAINCWNHTIIRVEGYANAEKFSKEDLIKLVPASHKVCAVTSQLSMDVEEFESDEELFDLENLQDDYVIKINVTPDADDPLFVTHKLEEFEPFSLKKIIGKDTHTFAKGSVMVAENIDKLKKLEKFYDNHIIAIDGYLYDGKPLMEKSDWKRHVPIFHKARAVNEASTNVEGLEKN